MGQSHKTNHTLNMQAFITLAMVVAAVTYSGEAQYPPAPAGGYVAAAPVVAHAVHAAPAVAHAVHAPVVAHAVHAPVVAHAVHAAPVVAHAVHAAPVVAHATHGIVAHG